MLSATQAMHPLFGSNVDSSVGGATWEATICLLGLLVSEKNSYVMYISGGVVNGVATQDDDLRTKEEMGLKGTD